MTLGEKIKKLRKDHDLSQVELAKKLGTHQSHIGRYEKDAAVPSALVIKKMAAEFNVSADYILSDGDDDISTSLVGDNELLRLFDEVSNMTEEDRLFVVKILKMAINNSKIKEMSV
ncbi:MAG: helix-turn-helix transcriptional regulator [bacterium]|nr:helix-turn-helix transcriptional regulator [bacterium]